jgi:hypothetical protein
VLTGIPEVNLRISIFFVETPPEGKLCSGGSVSFSSFIDEVNEINLCDFIFCLTG